MDTIDRKLLNRLQENFPIVSQPYQQLATELGLTEAEVLTRLTKLKTAGVIRRLGAVGDSKKLGCASTLIAMKVPAARLKEVVAIVNSYTSITHNYLREHEYNLWFTIIAKSEAELATIVNELEEKTGITNMLNLPVEKLFKIKVAFSF